MIPETKVVMYFIKVILFMNIGLTFAATVLDDDYYLISVEQLLKNAYPTHYALKLLVNTNSSHLNHSGLVIIQIHILSPTYVVHLNAKNLEIINSMTILVNDQNIFTVRGTNKIQKQILAITFEKKVPPGNYSLQIKFQSISEYNLYESGVHSETMTTEQKGNVILSQFGKIAARELFPCWDHPSFKATFDISVIHSQKYTALSNMPLLRRFQTNSDTIVHSIFAITPMISTHQLAIVLMPFNAIINPQETVFTWCKSNITSAINFMHNIADKVPKHLFRYISLTNISSVIQKTDQVVISNALYSDAHWGLLIYRESDIIYDNKKDSVKVKTKVANTVATQVARQVFGGLITPEWWNHSWLSESFALFLSRYVLDQMYDDWREVFFTVVEDLHWSLNLDAGLMPPVLFKIKTLFDIVSLKPTSNVYRKGSALLRMLQQVMGEETFRKGVIEYVNRHKYGVVTSDDLWSAMQFVLNATSKSFDVKQIMDTWIIKQGYPLVVVQRNYETGETIISQEPYHIFDFGVERYKWWIPVTYTTEAHPAFDYSSFPTVWLGPENENVSLETNPNDWIIVNVQQSGYYRVWYDRTNWEKIAYYLKFKDYSIIHVLNRAQIIDDICHFFESKLVDWSLFSYVTSYLSKEIDYIAWIPMLRYLDRMSTFFLFPESKKFQMYFASYFDYILNEIKYEEDPKDLNDDDLTRKGREILAHYACTLGNPTCRSAAADKLKKHLADPTTYEILPWWEYWTFCFGLKTGDISIWEQLYQLYAKTKKKKILYFLSCTEDPDIIIKFLHKIVEKNTIIEETDQAKLFNIIIKQHIGNNKVFNHIIDNIMIFKPNSISLNDAFDTITMNIYSEEQLDTFPSSIMSLIIDFDTCEEKKYKIELQRKMIQVQKREFDNIFPNKI